MLSSGRDSCSIHECTAAMLSHKTPSQRDQPTFQQAALITVSELQIKKRGLEDGSGVLGCLGELKVVVGGVDPNKIHYARV